MKAAKARAAQSSAVGEASQGLMDAEKRDNACLIRPHAPDRQKGDVTHPLDRPVWNALTSRQAHLALGEQERFLRFPADIEPFGATRDNSDAQLAELAAMMPLDGHVALAEVAKLSAPAGFVSMIAAVIHQMCAPRLTPPDDGLDVVTLSETDAPEMRALAELTQPGPFHARTHQLGDLCRSAGEWPPDRHGGRAAEAARLHRNQRGLHPSRCPRAGGWRRH